ncbi:MAG TPA: Ig-like domain-containing protein [Gemmatimonadales bacterium]|nr:Ig-like domain-containing protein [Gemmatimonadales bacterium]
MRSRFVVSLAAAFLLASCSPESTGITRPSGVLLAARPVTTVGVTPSGDTIGVGDTVTLIAAATNAKGDTLKRSFTFTASDPTVATVSATGVVAGVGVGSAVITATTRGGSATASFLVASCSAQLTLNPNAWLFKLVPGGFRSPSGISDEVVYRTVGVGFAAAPIYGEDTSHFVMGYNPGSGASDIAAGKVCTLSTSPLHTYTKLQVPAANVPGVVTTEEVFASNAPGATDYVLFRYTFTNTTAQPVTSFLSGLLVDWDLNWDSNPADDNLRWNGASALYEAVETDTITHPQIMGVAPMVLDGGVAVHGWVNGQDPVRGGLFQFLAGPPDTAAVGPNDIRELMGRGPVSIAPGGRYRIVFAMVGGLNRAAYDANLAAAQAAGNALLP